MSGTVDVRRRAILDRLAEHGRVEVGALSAVLGVTEETIRRDLRTLELDGLLRRAHGGAVRPDLDTDRHPDRRAAAALADHAVTLVDAGSAVFLGGGPACEALAGRLASTPGIVLVTGSVPVALAAALADERAVVHLIGGTADDHGLLTGAWAREQLSGLRLDVAVVEALGVATDGRLLHASPEEAAVIATAVGLAESTILLVDPEAFGAGGLAASVPAVGVATAVLADGVDPGAIEALLATGVRLETIGVGA